MSQQIERKMKWGKNDENDEKASEKVAALTFTKFMQSAVTDSRVASERGLVAVN